MLLRGSGFSTSRTQKSPPQPPSHCWSYVICWGSFSKGTRAELLTYFKLLQNTHHIVGRWGRGKVLPKMLKNHVWSSQLQTCESAAGQSPAVTVCPMLILALCSQQCSRASYASLALKCLDRSDVGLSPRDMVQYGHCPRNPIHGQLHVPLAVELHTGDNTVGSGRTKGLPGSALDRTSPLHLGRQGSPSPAVPARNCLQERLSNDGTALCRAPKGSAQHSSWGFAT